MNKQKGVDSLGIALNHATASDFEYRSDIRTTSLALPGSGGIVTVPNDGNFFCLRASKGNVTLSVPGDNTSILLAVGRTYRFDKPFGNNTISLSSDFAGADVVTFDIGFGLVIALDEITISAVVPNPLPVIITAPNPLPVSITGPNPLPVQEVFDNTTKRAGAILNSGTTFVTLAVPGGGNAGRLLTAAFTISGDAICNNALGDNTLVIEIIDGAGNILQRADQSCFVPGTAVDKAGALFQSAPFEIPNGILGAPGVNLNFQYFFQSGALLTAGQIGVEAYWKVN